MMGRVPACHTLWVVGAYRRGQIMIDRGPFLVLGDSAARWSTDNPILTAHAAQTLSGALTQNDLGRVARQTLNRPMVDRHPLLRRAWGARKGPRRPHAAQTVAGCHEARARSPNTR